VLSHEGIAEKQQKYRRLGDITRFLEEAARECAKGYPDGGPMRKEYFDRYLAIEETKLDPPGLIEGQELKAELLKEAARDREESIPKDEPGCDRGASWGAHAVREAAEAPQIERPVAEQPQTPEDQVAEWKKKWPDDAGKLDLLADHHLRQPRWSARQFEKDAGRLWHEHYTQKKAAGGDETPEPSVTSNRTDDDQQPDDSTMTGDSVTPVEPALTSNEQAPVVSLCGTPIDTPKAAPSTGTAAFNMADMLAALNK
jgi:hypothetical protein